MKLKSYDDDAQRSIDAQAFRNKFVEEMELLIGRKPRLSQDKNGRYIGNLVQLKQGLLTIDLLDKFKEFKPGRVIRFAWQIKQISP